MSEKEKVVRISNSKIVAESKLLRKSKDLRNVTGNEAGPSPDLFVDTSTQSTSQSGNNSNSSKDSNSNQDK